MKIAYKYRIYPNSLQKEYFAKCFGCVRFFYNKSLQDKIDYYNETGKTINPTPAKYKQEFEFLKEIDSLALANAQLARETAYKNFFSHRTQFPKYKSKKNDQSYTTNNQRNSVRFSDNGKYITIPKCKSIRIKKHRNFEGAVKSVTISMTCSGKYYISLLVETEDGKKLVNYALSKARDLGFGAVLIEGSINFYKNCGFNYAEKYGIKYNDLALDDLSFFLAIELTEGYLKNAQGNYITPEIYLCADKFEEEFLKYESSFPYKEKLVLEGQLK